MTDEESPRAMQFAARVEKLEPPALSDVFAATALGVIAVLDDHRSMPGGEWHVEVAAWNGARIRKIVRRARGAAWERAQGVPGLTIVHGSAAVRAFVPGIIDQAPPELAKLQIQSTPLDEPSRVDALPSRGTGSTAYADTPVVLTIGLHPAVEMSWGKRAAQVAHAAQRCWEQLDRTDRLTWNATGRHVDVVTPSAELWEAEFADAAVQIRDGGFTEVAPGTNTAAAFLRVTPDS